MKIELNFDLNENVDDIINQAIEKGLTEAAIFAQGEAKKKVPVDKGTLRDNIFYKVEGKQAIIYDNVEYAPYVELGTVKMQARPFLRPSVFNNRKQILNIVSNSLKEVL